MKKYKLPIVSCFVSMILSLSITAQEQPTAREQIAVVSKEKDTVEVKKEVAAKAKTPVKLKKEYSEILPEVSYFVEFAENIEVGHVDSSVTCSMFHSSSKDFGCEFSQEIAIGSKQMVSYALPYYSFDSNRVSGFGDVTLDYRYQLTSDKRWAIVTPRISLIIRTGKKDKELGEGSTGFEFNLPVTKRISESFLGTFNAGMTFLPKTKGEDLSGNRVKKNLTDYNLGGSLIWVANKHFNPLVEYVENFENEINEEGGVTRFKEHVISPGIGFAWEFGNLKVSPGMAVPITFSQGEVHKGIFFSLAFELSHVRASRRIAKK